MGIITKKIEAFLFITLLFLFPLGELGRFQIGDGVATKINDIAVFIVVVCWVLHKIVIKKKEITKTNFFTKPFIIFFCICIFSLLTNSTRFFVNELFVGFLYLLRLGMYISLFFIVSDFDEKFKKKIFLFLTVIGAVVLGIGYVQYIFYQNLRNLYYLGWDEHLYRLFSSFLDPNFAGVFFVLYLVFLCGLLVDTLHKKQINKSILYILLSSLTFAAILLTYSRSALFTLIVSMCIFLILTKNKKWIIGMSTVLIVFFIIASRSFFVENLNLLRTASSGARIETAKNALEIIAKNPIFGVGFNMYKYAQVKYGFRSSEQIKKSHADSGTDNSFLFILATTGVIGFVAYFFLWSSIIKKAYLIYKKSNNSQKIYSIVVLSSVSGLFISALFINTLFYPFLVEWVFIVAAVALTKE